MFKGHPKGLFVAFFSNMGERFGFYTMMAILVLFLQVKYGLSENTAGDYYSWFYFGVYAFALVGGLLADYTKKFKTVIMLGIAFMFLGYALLAVPGSSLNVSLFCLLIIAFGNGLFKGNLQAVVGQLYDDPKYNKLRDSAFMIFYMGINVGAFFAPFAAASVRDWFLKINGFAYDRSLPALCRQFLDNKLSDTTHFADLAKAACTGHQMDSLTQFANDYIDIFSKGYNYAFGIAAIAMVLSMLVYIFFNKHLPNKDKASSQENEKAKKEIVQISPAEEKRRLMALVLVFIVVIFFWMSFHQNGLTLTFFANTYIAKEVGGITYLFFGLKSILCVIGFIASLILVFDKGKTKAMRIGAAAGIAVFGALIYFFVSNTGNKNAISAEVFQSFNPLFIVFLTPVVMGVFAWLNKKGLEPSTPKKIGIGMLIAVLAFAMLIIPSLGLMSPHDLKTASLPESSFVSPYWLINTYLIFTIAELCLSPMGLSFVSKVAPPRFQGLMQAGWLMATAIGNKLTSVGSKFWVSLDVWQVWLIFVVCCLVSAAFIFSIMKRLEKATS